MSAAYASEMHLFCLVSPRALQQLLPLRSHRQYEQATKKMQKKKKKKKMILSVKGSIFFEKAKSEKKAVPFKSWNGGLKRSHSIWQMEGIE